MPEPPYRDDRETLLAENARLRARLDALTSARRRRVWLAVGALLVLALDVGAFLGLRALFNATDDGLVGLGVATLLGLVAGHIALVVWLVR